MLDDAKIPLLHCPTCYATAFKTSRARPGEWPQRLLRKLPVRCRKCNMRIFASRSYGKWLRSQEAGGAVETPSATGGISRAKVAE
jgi:hypothetical protein